MDISVYVFLLAVINPFAQVIYLWDRIEQIPRQVFLRQYLHASVLTWGVFGLMSLVGEPLLVNLFQVRMDALQVFGGLILLVIGMRAVLNGTRRRPPREPQPSRPALSVALPYLIGPGTIWISILVGQRHGIAGLAGIAIVLLANLALVGLLTVVVDMVRNPNRLTIVGDFVLLLMRTNALFIGAIGIDMMGTGMRGLAS